MKISTKGRYALRMMVDIAEHQKDGYVTLKDVAQHQDISKKYLEQIALHLSQAGMLRAVRGYQGGYMLAKPASEYTVNAVLQVVEGSMVPVTCLEQSPNTGERCNLCKTRPVWEGLNRLITSASRNTTSASPAASTARQTQRSHWGRGARGSSPAAISTAPMAGQIQLMFSPKREYSPIRK